MNMNNTNAKKAYIIKSKMRFVTFLILLFISLFTLTNIIFTNNDIAFGESAYKTSYENFDGDSYIIYEVHSGDSLWDIAEKYGNKENHYENIGYLQKQHYERRKEVGNDDIFYILRRIVEPIDKRQRDRKSVV